MARALLLGAALWFALPVAVALADLRLEVRTDRQALSLDDTLTLQITVQSQGTGSPRVEMPELEGFEVMSRQVQQPMQFSFSFGNRATVQSSTIYSFVLQPTRVGALTIKPVRAELDGVVKTSRAITITVSAGSTAPPGAGPGDPDADDDREPAAAPNGAADNTAVDPVAFVRTVADKSEPYEGEQVTVTIYLYVRERLQSSPNVVTEPTLDGLWVQDLLPPRGLPPGRQVVDGAVYAVYALRRFAAFPLRPGDITIGPMALEISSSTLFDLFAPRRARPNLNRSSAPLTLHVKPLPEQGKPAGEVAVGRFKLATKLDRSQTPTGDAVTLTATVQGEGNIRTVALALPPLKDIDVLQPEIKDLVESPKDLVSGTREYRWLLVPKAPGRITIPALKLATFDPSAQRYETLASEPLALEVVGQALPATAATPAPQPRDETPQPKPERGEAHHWAPIRTQSRLLRGYKRWSEQPWYDFALLVPPLAWLLVIGVDGARKRRKARGETAHGRVLREAEARRAAAAQAAREGQGARFYADASAALLTLLEARLGESMVGLTRAQLRERLDASGMPRELADALTRALEDYEFARFGSSAADPARLSAQAEALSALYERLHAFEPRAGGHAA
jgi:hypothetical protein